MRAHESWRVGLESVARGTRPVLHTRLVTAAPPPSASSDTPHSQTGYSIDNVTRNDSHSLRARVLAVRRAYVSSGPLHAVLTFDITHIINFLYTIIVI